MTRRKGKLSLMQLFGSHKTSILINDGPSFCYCTYVLRISDLIQRYFFVWFMTTWKKQILARAIRIPPKMGVTTHFSEIIEPKIGEKILNILYILKLVYNSGCLI